MISKPAYHQHEDFQTRVAKLEEIRELGVEPYPHRFCPSHCSKKISDLFDQEGGSCNEASEGKTPKVCVAGRMVLFRAMGKNAFAQLQDKSGRIQVMFNKNDTVVNGYDPENSTTSQPLSHMKFIEKKLDLGDMIGVEGHLFRTQKGELTVYATQVTLLTKTLLPLADKHGGLADKEARYRKRWLDLISNCDVCDTFRVRSRIIRYLRKYLDEQHFLEVETPVLQSIYGGAEARPFQTKLNALDQDMYMRISLEIPLKKLVVGGMDRIYEIGKVFRNEGIDHNHNPEFTLLEAYASYWDYNDMMVLVENLFENLALELHGTTKMTVPSKNNTIHEIDVKAPWKRMTMKESIKVYGDLDCDTMSDDDMRKVLEKDGYDHMVLNKLTRGLLIAKLFEDKVEKHLIEPHHITDHPVETTPLCKPHRDPKSRDEGLVERFESFVLGEEICNSYSELNDPEMQRMLLENQAKMREQGDEEAHPLDEEFIEAICQGMPPTGGIGIGVDRLVMLFTGSHSIRDVLYFPWMRPID